MKLEKMKLKEMKIYKMKIKRKKPKKMKAKKIKQRRKFLKAVINSKTNRLVMHFLLVVSIL